MKRFLLSLFLFSLALLNAWASPLNTIYQPDGTAFVRRNGPLMHNRPLYCTHMPVMTLAGDKPMLRLVNKHGTLGHFMLALQRGDQAKWMQDFSSITSRYRSNTMEWELTDTAFPNLTLRLTAVTLANEPGYAVKLTAQGAGPQDKLIWTYGGLTPIFNNGSWMDNVEQGYPNVFIWKVDPSHYPKLTERGFVPADCTSNTVTLDKGLSIIGLPAYTMNDVQHPAMIMAVTSNAVSNTRAADASAWNNPLELLASQPASLPIACGLSSMPTPSQPVYWVIENFEGTEVKDPKNLTAPDLAFAAGLNRSLQLEQQVVVDTPDPYFNAAVSAAAVSIDATWYPPVYVHGGMAWNTPYPGWRTIYGGTTYGWHDNVKDEAKYYISHQEKSDEKNKPEAEKASDLSRQSQNSMLYGKGKITKDSYGYNFQDQFFDQIVHAWRWTGDQELEAVLRPALDLHLDWMRRCFDPDGDGLYESYINTWPTDSVWYNGGASPEATAYAYTGEVAAAEMAQRAGDTPAAQAHRQLAEKIRLALTAKLWNQEKGLPGANLEQYGHQRRRDDPWLYDVFLPIDAQMWPLEQSLQALHYTEWGLERIPGRFGGVKCQTSNWVPGMWSVRQLHSGDTWHLALAYAQCGLTQPCWDLIQGFTMEMMFDKIVPAAISDFYGTDFNDMSSMFCRVVVEGLYGYRPDYPNDIVRCAPQIPADWDHASISTPDFTMHYTQKTASDLSWTLVLKKGAQIEFEAPIRAGKIQSVLLNGRPAQYKLIPGIGQTIIQAKTPSTKFAQLEVTIANPLPLAGDISTTATSGQTITLSPTRGVIKEFVDPQGVLDNARIERGTITAKVTSNTGDHLVLATVEADGLPCYQQFKLKVADPAGEAAEAAQFVTVVPATAKFTTVDMAGVFNGDIREIFKQQYFSPRPDTCSLRIRTNAYSAWNHEAASTPGIKLDKVASLVKDGQLIADKGVPFIPPAEGKNIAFTSLWDNWPDKVTVPVNKKADAAYFLVSGSTFPMHTRIANAEIRLEYADGQVDKLELVPPLNFWSLCPWGGSADYDYQREGFSLPKTPPATVQLGENCRAVLLNRRLRPDIELKSVTFETLSPEVVIGLMGVTLMDE